MPFLMELSDAVAHMTSAIDRGAAEHTFPWQIATAIKTAAALPQPLRMAAMKRLG
jgi:hypothetical protein